MIVLLVWAAIALAIQLVETVEVLQERNTENPQWTVNNTEIEFLEFLRQTALAQIDDDSDLAPVRLTFDIFYSRIQTLNEGKLLVPLRGNPVFTEDLAALTEFVTSSTSIIDAPDPELRAALPAFAARAESLRPTMRRTSMFTINGWAFQAIDLRETVLDTLTRMAVALAGAFALLVGGVVGLWLLYRENMRRALFVARARDRTQAAEATLRVSEARLREAQKIAKLGSWEVDAEGRMYWSDETFRIFDITPADFDGTVASFYKRCFPEDVIKSKQAGMEAWDTQKAYELTYRIKLPSGEVRNVIQRTKPVVDDSGKTVRLVGTVQDITEQTIAEEKLRQSQKMEVVGQLTGGVAHDFNNLLAVILGNLELLREKNDQNGNDVFIEAAMTASNRGAELTRNMLSFARQSRLAPKSTDLNQLVRETESWTSRVLPSSIAVEVSLSTDLWSVEVDQSLAQNALLNLFLNARDVMPDGGTLTIESSNIRLDEGSPDFNKDDVEPGQYVLLSVSDTGTGIAPSELSRIFEPFYTTKQVGSGSGLGLSMVQGFMRQSGGMVHVESERGRGTTFKLYFRACSAVDSETKVISPPTETKPQSGVRILLVEDEPAVLDVTAHHLSNAGYSVTPATSGDAALRMWDEEEDFDLLITDIVMPGTLQGPDLARELRARRSDLPVVYMSGYANEAMFPQTGQLVQDTRLMKPVPGADLISAVEQALDFAGK
ncbi:PAS domain-containing hybrid sensor histidine kinase/response regulator [Shimia ponticola]|uniref:PAS domain-containing hybrid sensor histidine kinase/response regulator n=1 Tax=Shimia ponticola TaxID=2582893 RepID=UPI0011BE7B52|nr:PAS domain-containing hybrid sensor histidine kinase/response regulator [Shimia ponticola]